MYTIETHHIAQLDVTITIACAGIHRHGCTEDHQTDLATDRCFVEPIKL